MQHYTFPSLLIQNCVWNHLIVALDIMLRALQQLYQQAGCAGLLRTLSEELKRVQISTSQQLCCVFPPGPDQRSHCGFNTLLGSVSPATNYSFLLVFFLLSPAVSATQSNLFAASDYYWLSASSPNFPHSSSSTCTQAGSNSSSLSQKQTNAQDNSA